MQWLAAHWLDVVVAILAIDRALLKLMPDSPVLNKIKDALSKVVPGE